MPLDPFDHEYPAAAHALAHQRAITTVQLRLIVDNTPWLQLGTRRLASLDPDGIHIILACEHVANPGPDPAHSGMLMIVQLRLSTRLGTTDVVHAVIPADMLGKIPTAGKVLAEVSTMIGAAAATWSDDAFEKAMMDLLTDGDEGQR